MTQEPFAVAQVDWSTREVPLQAPLAPEPDGTSVDSRVRTRISGATTLQGSALCLHRLTSGGFAVWEDGRLIETRARVDQLRGLRIEIHVREHGPPHFHVTAPGINASFAIADCSLLVGELSRRDLDLVEYWYKSARPLLVRTWNETRPSDCPIGPIFE